MVLFFNPYIFASSIISNLPYVTDNLVAYWEQSGYSTGTINVTDLSGQNHPVQYSVSTPSTVTSTSVSSNANTILTNDSYTLNFANGLTYEVLFTLASVANGQDPTIMFWDPYSGGGGQMMNISASNLVPYMYNANINQGYVYPGSSQLNTGQWYHVTFTSNPQGIWNFYLDGYLTATGTGFVMPSGPQVNYSLGVSNPVSFVNQYQTTTSCLAYWDFGVKESYPGTGTSVTSLSYTSTTGTIIGSSSFNNNLMTLSSASSNISNTGVTLNLAGAGTTFETLFVPSTLTGNIMSFSNATAVSLGLNLNLTSNVQLIVNNTISNTFSMTMVSGVAYHVALAVSPTGAFSYYVDGFLFQTGQIPFTLPSNLIQTLGLGAPQGAATGFTGSFAMARVYNYALTPAQVIRNYQAVLNKFSNNPYSLPLNTANTYATSNLIGYWDFTKTCSYTGGQTFVNDIGGGGRNLNIVSSVLPTYTSNGYASITAGTGFGANVSTLVNYSNLLTAECMFCTGSLGATGQPIMFHGTGSSTNGFLMTMLQTNSGGLSILGPSGSWYRTSSNVNFTNNTWYHLMAVIDKTRTLYLYINGTQAATFTNTTMSDPVSSLMGFGVNPNADPVIGYKLALGRVYNIPLTPNQIWNNYVASYNTGLYSNVSLGAGTQQYVTSGLIGYWDFSSSSSYPGSGTSVTDLSGSGNNLTISGTNNYTSTGAIALNLTSSTFGSYLSNTSTSFTPITGLSAITVEWLMNFSSTSGAQYIVDTGYGVGLSGVLSNGLNGLIQQAGGGSSAGGVVANKWNHVVIVASTSTSTNAVYINGVKQTLSTNVAMNPITISRIWFGQTSQGIYGNVAMMRVYTTGLTYYQVRQNYQAVFNKLAGNPYGLPSSIPIYPPAFANFSTVAVTNTIAFFSGYSYGNGAYTASSSSTGANGAGAAFVAGSFFTSAATTYSATTPGACTSGKSLGGITGEWVNIQLPYPTLVTNYTFTTTNSTATTNAPNNWRFIGSKDNVNWTILHSYTGTYGTNFNTYINTFTTSNQDYYQYYALVVTNVSAGTICSVGNFSLYGYPNQSQYNAPWPVSLSSNISSGPTPYITTNLVGYWDAAVSLSSPLSGLLLNDLSGNGSTMTFTAVPSYTSTGAISFGLTTSQYASTLVSTTFTNQITMETLVNFTSLPSAYSVFLGSSLVSFALDQTPKVIIGAPAWNFSNTSVINIQTGLWYHIVWSMTTLTTAAMYINGQSVSAVTFAGTGTNIGSMTNLYLNYNGASAGLNASYAFCRIYNSSLSASQVQTNYLNALTRLAGNPYNLPIPTTGLASGGNITLIPNSNTYVHQFTTSGTLTVTATITANVLVIGGGGGGGNNQGGCGGGAGGVVYLTNQVLYPGTYSVIVGQGGASQTNGSNSWVQGLTSIVAVGGGRGGDQSSTGSDGGSGGGSGNGTASNGVSGQGYSGGTTTQTGSTGGGGGGAGAVGGSTTSSTLGGIGGNGLPFNITGTTVWYAGGGGGGNFSFITNSQLGGLGGGGNGAGSGNTAGTPNTGGGGGGGGGTYGTGAAGGSGIVIISYTDGLTSNVGYSLDNVAAVNSDQGSATGLYALKRLTRRYTGPVVRLTDSSGNNGTDFYSDSLGNLSTLAGVPVLNWIQSISPSAIPLVSTWYDQSGLGNHGTIGVAPQFDYINNRLDFTAQSGTAYFRLPNGTIPYGDQSYTISTRTGTTVINDNQYFLYVTGGTNGSTVGVRSSGNPATNMYITWSANDTVLTSAPGSLVQSTITTKYARTTGGTNKLIYVNNITGATTGGGGGQSSSLRNGAVATGYIGSSGTSLYLNSQLYYMSILNSNVSIGDQQFIENQYINQDLYYSNVMILLHCQGFNGQSLTSNIIDNSPYALQPTYAITSTPTCSTTTPKFGYSSWNFPATALVTLTPSVSTQYTFGSNNFTICFWINPSIVSLAYYFLGNTTNTGTLAANQWRVSMSSSGFPQFEYYTTSPQSIVSSVAITASTWHHIGVTRNGTTLTLWVNGVSRATGSLTGSLDTVTTNTLTIGPPPVANTMNFQELRITKDTVRYVTSPFPLQVAPTAPQEYPPLAASAGSTTITAAQYGNGVYTASTSTGTGWNAFDKAATGWTGSSVYVSGTPYATATPATTTNTSAIILGDWVQLQTPVLVTLLQYSIHPISASIYPSAWTLLGSKDGTSWTTLDTQSNQTYKATMVYNIASTNSNSFYFRLIVTTMVGATTAQIGEIKYYGY